MKRASSDDGGKEQAIWRAAKLAALFLLSFGVAFRFYAGLDTATGGPVVRQRSLREEASPSAAAAGSAPPQQLLVSDLHGAAAKTGAAQYKRCTGVFGRCKAAHGHRLPAAGAGGLPCLLCPGCGSGVTWKVIVCDTDEVGAAWVCTSPPCGLVGGVHHMQDFAPWQVGLVVPCAECTACPSPVADMMFRANPFRLRAAWQQQA
jgi:hypothetical protein